MLGGVLSQTQVNVLRVLPGHHGVDDLATAAESGGPDVEEESPEVVLECRRVLQVEQEDIPEQSDQ